MTGLGVWLLLGFSSFAVIGAPERPRGAEKAPGTNRHEPASAKPASPTQRDIAGDRASADRRSSASKRLIRLDPRAEVWIDPKGKRVIVGGVITLREGPLEMFACPRGTKDYESVVGVHSKASLVHTALLAIGAKPGRPAQYVPKYRPATGDVIQIDVVWKDAAGKTVKRPAQQLVRNLKTGRPMEYDWVFGGSGFWQEEEDSPPYYLAEGGELICLSNFSSATLDLPVKSSQDNQDLLFEALTENIPPVETPVRLVLRVKRRATEPAKTRPDPVSSPKADSDR